MRFTTIEDGANPWFPLRPVIANVPGMRSAEAYDAVLDAHHVDVAPRYKPRGGNTFCNVFCWDVTTAMGAEIPHWVGTNGEPSTIADRAAREQTANDMQDWLNSHGQSRFGWRKVLPVEAYAAADLGCPAVVIWHSGTDKAPGHIAMVVPGEVLAQAGSLNFRRAQLGQCFNTAKVPRLQWWIHD